MDSGNLVAMFSVNAQPEWNFFEHDWKTWTDKGKTEALDMLACKFSTETQAVE